MNLIIFHVANEASKLIISKLKDCGLAAARFAPWAKIAPSEQGQAKNADTDIDVDIKIGRSLNKEFWTKRK